MTGLHTIVANQRPESNALLRLAIVGDPPEIRTIHPRYFLATPRCASAVRGSMYTTCLFCHQNLGANEVVEAFPVGRRLAFDPALGRLWVVCGRCGRWNLSALEERWEAIESCERQFRDTRLRVSTGEIGLARVAEGLELVRIGAPERPELAAWRYGREVIRRRRKQYLYAGLTAAVGIPLVAMGAYGALVAALPGGSLAIQSVQWLAILYDRRRVVVRTASESGEPVSIRGIDAATAGITCDEQGDASWGLEIEFGKKTGRLNLRGSEAVRVLSHVLATVNQTGGSAKTVRRAVERLEDAGSPAELFSRYGADSYFSRIGVKLVKGLPADERIALEMATHEQSERRALEGELAELELAWKEAEEIAAISDSLFLPASVEAFIQRHKPSR